MVALPRFFRCHCPASLMSLFERPRGPHGTHCCIWGSRACILYKYNLTRFSACWWFIFERVFRFSFVFEGLHASAGIHLASFYSSISSIIFRVLNN